MQALPDELEFCFQPGRSLCRSFHLHNLADSPVAFKLKTNAATFYVVKPGRGVIPPGHFTRISVYMQPQQFMPVCHQFLLQVTPPVSGARLHAEAGCFIMLRHQAAQQLHARAWIVTYHT